jgi:type I restriction enzyme S subunit
MNEWQTLTLADVCTLITDGAHQSPKTVLRGKPMASVKDLTRFGVDLTGARHIAMEDFEALVKQGCKPHVGDVLIAKDGNSALDTVCTVDHPLDAVLLSSVAILRPDPKCLDSVFLKFYLSSPETIDYLKGNFISGAAIPRVVLRDFKRAEIRLPSLNIQKRIAAVLQSIDSKIELNHRINQTLEAIAQAIFKSWFVDFDPVKAKIAAKQEGRDPMRAAMSAITGKSDAELDALPPEQYAQLAATAALFPDEMEESELEEIPRGWIVSDMRTLAEVISKGTTPSKVDLANAKDVPIVPFVKVKDISEDGEIARGNLELIARSIHESSLKRSILKTDDLLFSIAGTIGRTAFVDNDLNDANVNQAIAFIRLKEKLDHFALCWLTLRNIETKNFIASKVVQAVQANASLANVGEIPVKLPGNDVLKKWNSVVSPLILEYRARLGEIRTLATLRDTLLPKLMSGELSVTALTESTGVA